MRYLITIVIAASCLTAFGQGGNICEYPELLVPRVVFLDADSDGVWLSAQSDDPLIWDLGAIGDSLFVQECGTHSVRELVDIEGVGQLPCGFSEEVMVVTEECLESELEFELEFFCGEGTIYDFESGKCIVAIPSDSNFDGCIQLNDLLDLLGAYGDCIAEESPWQCGDLIEHDSYDYSTVQIGDQCWFSENCRYLPEVSPSSASSTTAPYYYVYDYEGTDVTAAQATDNYETYGVLYNWPAVMTEGICPSDWHIPTDGEWQTMEISLGMSESEANDTGGRGTNEGAQMKSTSGWNGDGNGSNSSGFKGLPGGYAYNEGFYEGDNYGFWRSSSVFGNNDAWKRRLSSELDDVGRNATNLSDGFSARCIIN